MDTDFTRLRIRCQILKTIAALAPCTSLDVERKLSHLTAMQVQKGIGKLLEADEIEKVGKVKKTSSAGRERFLYDVIDRDGWSPKKTAIKRNRKTHSDLLQTSRVKRQQDMLPNRYVVRYRDRKIRLLEKMKNIMGGSDKDLIIGMINDFRHM